jgi:lambda family phage portal protein
MIDHSAAHKQEIFERAVTYLAAAVPALADASTHPSVSASKRQPLLYGPNNQPIYPDSYYNVRRSAAKKTGSMQNWTPQRFYTRDAESREREDIALRATDLVNNDPHAAGAVSGYAETVVGPGLVPLPSVSADVLGYSEDSSEDKKKVREVQKQMRSVYICWYRFADAGQRMTFGEIQHLIQRNLIQYGEYLVLCHMIDDPARPYALALQVINPLRLKTPSDLATSGTIRDGVELGPYGEPVAYWIKKSSPSARVAMADTSANFVRIEARRRHRWKVLHNFVNRDPEQLRGVSDFAPAMAYFKDLNEYLGAELMSNIITAAFSLFVESGSADPLGLAQSFSTITDQNYKSDNSTYDVRFQEMQQGGNIIYGNNGQKVTPIVANRPGQTFEPFLREVKKAIAMSLNIPYTIAFKDVDRATFAVFRSAMLEAWRVFSARRIWLGQGFCQPVFTMLMEEAYLTGALKIDDFYTNPYAVTHAEWHGAPKGDIEPAKAALADIELINAKLKTRAEAIAERGGELTATLDQLQEEDQMMTDRNLKNPQPGKGAASAPITTSAGTRQPQNKTPVDPDNPESSNQEEEAEQNA